ncbi:MAG: GTP cyclohydrolase FolE2 [bacterium]
MCSNYLEVIIISKQKRQLEDIQGESDPRAVGLNCVGIRDFKLPLKIKDRSRGTQQVVADVNIGVNLSEDERGAHLSRFVELAEKYRQSEFSFESVPDFLHDLTDSLNSTNAYARFEFDYFIEKKSPSSDKKALMDFNCGFGGLLEEGEMKTWIEAEVPLTTLCPCSKEISRGGAHNQRAKVKSKAVINRLIWLEEFIEIIEGEGSSQLYSLLKREDEAYVTEEAYNNPKFVEDIARDLSLVFADEERIDDFWLECISYESIHNHNAYATVRQGSFWDEATTL